MVFRIRSQRLVFVCAALLLGLHASPAGAQLGDQLADTVERVKPSIVGVGTYAAVRRPQAQLRGTGFVVADGRHVVTAAHVLPTVLDAESREEHTVFIRRDGELERMTAEVVHTDTAHDVALLRILGRSLPALSLAEEVAVREGQLYAFTGFPIGAVLGLFPVTHRGIVSSITPVAAPMAQSRQLDARTIKRLRDPYRVYQLDATAYPGNSGSPLYDIRTGEVVALVNSVLVKESREKVLEEPSGITYAIPARHIQPLIERIGNNW